MTIRRAAESDLDTLRDLWLAFEREVPEPAHVDPEPDRELEEIRAIVREDVALLAEEDGSPVGFALARRRGSRLARLTDLYVLPDARRRGVAAALVREVVAAFPDVEYLDLEVQADNAGARAVYERWGFRENLLNLVAPRAEVERRVRPREAGASFGAIHVQTDDLTAVERTLRSFVPRLPDARVEIPRDGWIRISDDRLDPEPKLLARLAREISDRMGAVVLALGVEEGAVVRFSLFERGKLMDEYLSVQEYYGPLPPGDVIGLAANPTVVGRLTGADPAAVRAAALHASRPEDLPPPAEILHGLARAIGVEG